MKQLKLTLLPALFFVLHGSFYSPFSSKHFTIERLAPGIWAAINNDNFGHAICNAGIIDLGDKTVIYDPFMNLDAAADLKLAAEQLTGKDATVIINSHYHNDHVRGNQLFTGATIISTAWTRNQIAINEPEELAWEKSNAAKIAAEHRTKLETAAPAERQEWTLWTGYYEAMITNAPLMKTTLPNLTFSDSMWLHGATRSLLLKEFRNGHTASDVVAMLPTEGVAFMGDLLFEKRHPYLGHGKPEDWIKHIEGLEQDATIRLYVPGHGAVSNKEILRTQNQYIRDVRSAVQDAKTNGSPDSLIKKLPILPPYKQWMFSRFYGANLNTFVQRGK